ncbi:MAG: DUF4351 domain-containing protein [Opitutales bacterium]|nr:DUF4351 domain-containing protein [Opitutales bacterium]MCH8541918.1 DUF4351 domain-containing protein [Opitutales bacterium]
MPRRRSIRAKSTAPPDLASPDSAPLFFRRCTRLRRDMLATCCPAQFAWMTFRLLTYQVRICLTYLTEAGNTLDRESLYTIINEVTSTHLKEEAMSIADQLRQEGRQEGREEGRQEGERMILQRLIARKFGELDYVSQEKLNHAGLEELECWGERILDAKTLEEVFGE